MTPFPTSVISGKVDRASRLQRFERRETDAQCLKRLFSAHERGAAFMDTPEEAGRLDIPAADDHRMVPASAVVDHLEGVKGIVIPGKSTGGAEKLGADRQSLTPRMEPAHLDEGDPTAREAKR